MRLSLAFLTLASLVARAEVPDIQISPPSPSRPAAGRSQAPGRRVGESEPFFDISTRFRHNSGVPEFRSSLIGVPSQTISINPGPLARPTGDLSISRTEISASLLALHAADFTSRLGFMLPINTLSSTNDQVAQGSELGGYEISLGGRYLRDIGYRVSWAQHRSGKLHLHDPNDELGVGLYYEIREASQDSLVSLLLGPELEFPFMPSDPDAVVAYQMNWGGRARVQADTGIGSDLHFRWGVTALLRRVNGYSVAGVEQGGAGLFAAMPSAEYEMMRDLWVGVAAEIPLFRPEGREEAFGNVGLPGLFGSSFGVTVRVSAL
ncbi:MAG: hypothetical protein JST16_07805 [Bdellovibrionales bacterium]|nr:hypothetical protein [Bdellovibrionales bacterium]